MKKKVSYYLEIINLTVLDSYLARRKKRRRVDEEILSEIFSRGALILCRKENIVIEKEKTNCINVK